MGEGFNNGGGITIAEGTFPFLSNLTVTQNFNADKAGGGISIYHQGNAAFDPVNRCNVYLNWSGGYNDISHGGFNPRYPIDIYLDTATVKYPSRYFFRTGRNDVLDIKHGKIDQKYSNLYVDPETGRNKNSGASLNEPLKNVHYALALVAADTENRGTIHLAPGTYSFSGSGEFLPLNLRSYVSIVGAGKEETIFDLDGSLDPAMSAYLENKRDFTLSSFQIRNAGRRDQYDMEGVLVLNQNINVLLEDLLFTQNSMHYIIKSTYYSGSLCPDSTSITIRDCDFINNSGYISTFYYYFITIENCRFMNGVPYYYGITGSTGALALRVNHHSFATSAQSRRIENCVFTNNLNEVNLSGGGGSQTIVYVESKKNVDFVNCTFADNFIANSNSYGAVIVDGHDAGSTRFANCIFWGNAPSQMTVWGGMTTNEVIFSHNIVQDLDNISQNVTLLDGNMSSDPQFSLLDSNDYSLSASSAAIDAGTAFFVWDGDTIVNLSPNNYVGEAPDIGALEYQRLKITPEAILPKKLRLQSAYPNPFNSNITIKFEVPFPAVLSIKLYDIKGRLIKEQLNAWLGTGQHSFSLDGNNLASGTYFLQISDGKRLDSRKIVLLK
jgi:hypothetical protein